METIKLGEGFKKENCHPEIKCQCGYVGITKQKDNIDSWLKYKCPECNKQVRPTEVLGFVTSTASDWNTTVNIKTPTINIKRGK